MKKNKFLFKKWASFKEKKILQQEINFFPEQLYWRKYLLCHCWRCFLDSSNNSLSQCEIIIWQWFFTRFVWFISAFMRTRKSETIKVEVHFMITNKGREFSRKLTQLWDKYRTTRFFQENVFKSSSSNVDKMRRIKISHLNFH